MAGSRADQTRRLIDLMDRLAVSAGLVAAAGWPDLELTMPQLRALALLRQGSCRMGAFAEHLGTGLPAATTLVERLEAKGLVARHPDTADRRVVCCRLTDLGAAQLEQFWRMEQAELEAVAALLTEPELARVVDAVGLLARALDRHRVHERPPPPSLQPPPPSRPGRRRRNPRRPDTPRGGGARPPRPTPEESTMPEATITHLNLSDPHFRETAFDTYADLRGRCPVSRVKLSFGEELELAAIEGADPGADGSAARNSEVVFVAGYDEAVAALLDDRLGVDLAAAMTEEQRAQLPPTPEEFRPLQRSLLSVDPPDHTRLRRLVQPSFSARAMDALKPRIQQIADDLLDEAERAAAARGEDAPDRSLELNEAYAFPLPMKVISEMLGVPEEDRESIRRWSDSLLGAQRAPTEEIRADLRAFIDYLGDLFAAKRRQPGDDLTSSLVHAEEDGDRLNEDELLSMVFLLIVAGHVTTVNLIGSTVYALLTNPDQLGRLRADPGLVKSAVEEGLRYYGPAETTTLRFAREEAAVGGVTIPQGERVIVGLGAADRDPARFPDPDRFVLGRPEVNRHVAFGKGIHACLGAPLARLEAQIALAALLARAPELRLAVPADEIRWRPGFLRGLESLPLCF